MQINDILKKLLVTAAYIGFLFLIYFFTTDIIAIPEIILFAIGSCIAIFLLIGDKYLFSTYYNEEQTSSYVITRSTIFILLYIPLSLFVITSSGSEIGLGIILTIGTNLLLEMVELRNNPPLFQQTFLSQLKKTYTAQDITKIVIGAALFLIFIHIFAFR